MLGRNRHSRYASVPQNEEIDIKMTTARHAPRRRTMLFIGKWRYFLMSAASLGLLVFLAVEFRLLPKSYSFWLSEDGGAKGAPVNGSKAIVIASYKEQNVSWLSDIPSEYALLHTENDYDFW